MSVVGIELLLSGRMGAEGLSSQLVIMSDERRSDKESLMFNDEWVLRRNEMQCVDVVDREGMEDYGYYRRGAGHKTVDVPSEGSRVPRMSLGPMSRYDPLPSTPPTW